MTVNVSKPALNVREKLAELDKPTGIAGEAMLRAETVADQFDLIGASRTNLLINGNFDIAQRGTSKTGGFGSSVKYLLDRWATYRGAYEANMTVSQQAITDLEGSRYCIRVARSSGNTSTATINLVQQIEERTCIPLQGKQITASLYLRVGTDYTDGDIEVNLFTTTGGDLSTAGNSSGTLSNNTVTVMPTTSWQKVVVTRTVPSDAESISLTVRYGSPSGTAGSNDYFEVAQAQVVVGNYPDGLPFLHRSYGEELALCQRYYYREDTSSHFLRSFYAASTGDLYEDYPLPVVMRATPTWTSQLGSDISKVNAVSISGRTKKSGYVIFTISSTGEGYCSLNTVTADAEL